MQKQLRENIFNISVESVMKEKSLFDEKMSLFVME